MTRLMFLTGLGVPIFALVYISILLEENSSTWMQPIPFAAIAGILATTLFGVLLDRINREAWRAGYMFTPTTFIFMGHFGGLAIVLLLSSMKSGSASGLALVLPILWSVAFYSIGLLFGFFKVLDAEGFNRHIKKYEAQND